MRGPSPRISRRSRNAAGRLGAELVELGDASGGQVLLDAGREVAADAGQGGELAARGHRRHVLAERLQRLGRALIGANAEHRDSSRASSRLAIS